MQLADVAVLACRRLSRNLTCSEWREHLRDDAYQKTCPILATGCDRSVPATASSRAGIR